MKVIPHRAFVAILAAWLLLGLAGAAPAANLGTEEGCFSVRDYGAKGDGATDDTAAFRATLTAAGTKGGWVFVPPVARGKGYVLTNQLTVPDSVSLIGSLTGCGSDGAGGTLLLARPAANQYPGTGAKKALFRLNSGSTVKGFRIIYDQQPFPNDQEFQSASSPSYYASFEAAREGFIRDQVKPYGPTFYLAGIHEAVEDIVIERCNDAFYFGPGAKYNVSRIKLYGYGRGLVFQESADVNLVNQIEIDPGVLTLDRGGKTYSWAQGLIASSPQSVGLWLGKSDGYTFNNIAMKAVNVGIRYGASTAFRMSNPLTNSSWVPPGPAIAPWGSLSNFSVEGCVIGVQFVWPGHLTNRIVNARIVTGVDDGQRRAASKGSGNLAGVARQAALAVEDSHVFGNCAYLIPVFQGTNVTIGSEANPALLGPAAASIQTCNGRAFYLNGDVQLGLSGLHLGLGCDAGHLWAQGPAAGTFSCRLLNVIQAGQFTADRTLDTAGEHATAHQFTDH